MERLFIESTRRVALPLSTHSFATHPIVLPIPMSVLLQPMSMRRRKSEWVHGREPEDIKDQFFCAKARVTEARNVSPTRIYDTPPYRISSRNVPRSARIARAESPADGPSGEASGPRPPTEKNTHIQMSKYCIHYSQITGANESHRSDGSHSLHSLSIDRKVRKLCGMKRPSDLCVYERSITIRTLCSSTAPSSFSCCSEFFSPSSRSHCKDIGDGVCVSRSLLVL